MTIMRRRGFLKTAGSVAVAYLTSQYGKAAQTNTSKNRALKIGLIPAFERLIPQLMRENLIPGSSIALIRDGKLVWSRGFGIKSTDSKDPVDDETIFEAASISKTVFAYAILKLCDKGTLNLDTPLTKYVPWRFLEGDPRLDQITVRHILSHSTGFQDWRSDDNPLKIRFTPGRGFAYAGEGYYYLQSVLTHLSGRVDRSQCAQYEGGVEVCATDFDAWMKAHLLEPFGMRASTYEWTEGIEIQIALGHDEKGKRHHKVKPRRSDIARYGSAGALLTTARDYTKFLLEILTPKPADDFRLSAGLRKEMIRPHIKLPHDELIDGATSWSLGWGVQERKDGNYLVHSGGQSGFRCLAMASPERRSGFILLSNSDNGGRLIYDGSLLELLDRVLVSSE
jgi:CubicO group peptidase (beta-lactamase class C family)